MDLVHTWSTFHRENRGREREAATNENLQRRRRWFEPSTAHDESPGWTLGQRRPTPGVHSPGFGATVSLTATWWPLWNEEGRTLCLRGTTVRTPRAWLSITGSERRGITGRGKTPCAPYRRCRRRPPSTQSFATLLARERELKETGCNPRALDLEPSSSRAEIVESTEETDSSRPLLRKRAFTMPMCPSHDQ
jgi:hypothetical protein